MAGESSIPESIFFAALEKPTADEQAAYLDQACGQDTDLRRRVEKLLAAQPKVGKFLEEPMTDLQDAAEPASSQEAPGTVIGPYKLLQEIGEGGFGIVYMAEQLEPVRRHVALKIIKPGMDTREVIARFEAERQALAMMDHSNIARILDAGATKSGRPYFVMELVKGVPITEFCDKNNFDTEKRLELFMTVCRAVQHAHQKGVIHRDIKPSNIMITLHDGDPVPKVIDFGVSKAISQRLTEKTLFTRYGQMIGTPQYMSPEQAEMSGLDVDTRSDVYSLGVLLYELLTGTTPLESEKLRTAGYAEMVRMIQTEEPAKPSTRVSSLGDSQTVVCEHRSTDPKRLRQMFRGDLDWIVMKALEKHRDCRYETATEFARDIERHLKDEPVIAGPPSATYLLSKIVRRNKVAVVTVSVVLAALIIGLAAALWGFANARHHRGIAESRLGRAEVAEKDAIAQRDIARVARTAAETAVQEKAAYAGSLERYRYNIHIPEADEAFRRGNHRICREKLESCPVTLRGWEWAFLKKRLDNAAVRFDGNGNPIYTPDGRLITIGERGSDDEFNALIWDVTTGKNVGKFESDSKLSLLAMSPDGKILAAGSDDGTLTVWNEANPQVRWAKQKKDNRILGLAIGPNGSIAVADASGGLTVYNAANESVKFDLPTLAPSSESPTEATPPTQGNETSSDAKPLPKWNRVQFSPDGKWIALGSHTFDGVGGRLHVDRQGSLIILIDASTGKIVAEFDDGYFLPTFRPDSKTIATAIKDGTYKIVLWNWDGKTKSLTQIKSWPVSDDPENTIMDFSFRAGSTHLASLERRNPKIWDVQTGKEIAERGAWRADWMTMHPTKDQVAFFHNDRNVHVWNYAESPREEAIKVKLPERGNPIFSPNGKWIAIGGTHAIGGKLITVVEAATGEVHKSFAGTMIRAPWFPDSSRLVVVRGPNHRVEIVNALTGKLELLLEETGEIRPNLRGAIWPFVSDDGRVVTTVTRNLPEKHNAGWIRTWDASTGDLIQGFKFESVMGWTQTCVDVNHKTNRVAIGTENRTVEIWDTESKSLSRTVRSPGVIHFSIDLSADGDRLYIGEYGNELTVYDFDTESEIEIGGVSGGHFAFSPKGDQVVVIASAGYFVVDVETTRRLITLFEAKGQGLGPVDWSPDGKRIAAVITTKDKENELHIWDLPKAPNVDTNNARNTSP